MKTNKNLFGILFLFSCILGCTSCDNENDPKLIDPSYKSIEISCGIDFEIPVLADNWTIESVEEVSSGIMLQDKNNNPLTLEGNGEVEAKNGWLALSRKDENGFTIKLKENFDPEQERKLRICINSNGENDYVTIIQKSGKAYKLVKTKFEEIQEERETYIQAIDSITRFNPSNEDMFVQIYDKDLFKNVIEFSEFESDDYGAFSWIPEEGIQIYGPELKLDDNRVWGWDNKITYMNGTVTRPHQSHAEGKISTTLKPNKSIKFIGKIKYYKRKCKYTFTIENSISRTQFEVSGIWTHILPADIIIETHDK